jgi:tetraacyldisaccharide 4'-kinase
MNPLSPLGWVYGFAANARSNFYDRHIFESFPLGALTVSIGNLTTGGTGKTPLVAYVSSLLADRGERVCVLSRGYGRRNSSERILVSDGMNVLTDARTGGDEPVELANKLLGKAAVVADGDRVAAAKWAREHLSSTAFVLDDAFQHRRALRDLDIVCIDSTNPFGNGKVLPAGILRENLSSLSRADAVVITRCDLVRSTVEIEETVRQYAPELPIFHSSNKISQLSQFNDITGRETETKTENEVRHSPAFAFCGLGNPSNFFRQLEKEGFKLTGRKIFADHHFYSDKDLAEIETRARSVGAECLITTVKDAVRLTEMKVSLPCYVAEIDTVFTDPKAFREMIFSLEAPSYRPNKTLEPQENTQADRAAGE